MKNLIYIVGLLCFASISLQGQVSYKKLVDAGNEALEEGKYYAAMRYYFSALEKENSDIDIWYKYAQAAHQQHAYERARMAYAFIVETVESTEYPDALYNLAALSITNESYDQAEKYFQQYLDKHEGEDGDLDKQAKLSLESAKWAQEQLDKPVRNSTHLGKEVNSPYSEHSPVWHDDELKFVSLKYGRNETGRYLSKVLALKDSLSTPLPSAANFNEPDYLTSDPAFSEDGSMMFYTKCEYDENDNIICKIHFRKKGEEEYAMGVSTNNLINQDGYTSTHPTIVELEDKMLLYFVSDRPGGKGGYDIWYSEVGTDLRFSAPENAEELNTEFDEITPHFQKSTQDFYFSTNGRVGFGGFDVYKSKTTDGLAFTDFENLGLSVNSSYHDLHFFESDDGQHAYLSSNRKGSFYADDSFETCCYDIYEVEPKRCETDVLIMVFDAVDSTAINDAYVTVSEFESGEEAFARMLKGTNTADTYLDCIKDYKITSKKDGYVPASMELLLSEKGLELNGKTDTVRIYMEPSILNLNLFVYDIDTKERLKEATLILIDQETGMQKQKYNLEGNDFVFSVLPSKLYTVKSSRPGYIADEIKITVPPGRKTYNQDIFLHKTPIEKKIVTLKEVLPIRLFFDNDQPNPKSMGTTTTIKYADTYDTYYSRKAKFKKIYTSRFSGNRKFEAEQAIDNFFEGELRRNNNNLNKFMSTLLEVLEAGRTVNLYFRGFASPLSVSEYNFNLGKRRVESMLLELRGFRGGVFLKYIANGQIILTERSFGETSAPSNVSDDFSDVGSSIYSPEASFERRVEIQEIEVNREQ